MTCFIQPDAHDASSAPIPIHCVLSDQYQAHIDHAAAPHRQWAHRHDFQARAGEVLIFPSQGGEIDQVWVGVDPEHPPVWALAGLPSKLPKGQYVLATQGSKGWPEHFRSLATIGFGLGAYRFDRYKRQPASSVQLVLEDQDPQELMALVEASHLARDIVNTPTNDMGPEALANTARAIAKTHGADCQVIVGDELERSFPAIHAVGRASAEPPRLITFKWGRQDAPALALVGKGVVFDSGGLSIKPASGMAVMKKDLGGAAHVLALAQVIMTLGLDVNLRVYIPAVENAIAGNAYRPSDIINTRKGSTVEVGNTDAEGRLVLADALTLACEEGATRIIDFATLTGAARVALGEDLPPIYGRDQAATREIQALSFELDDPLWPMPLFEGYRSLIQPPHADLSNTGGTPMAGSITAALFLDHFVAPEVDWFHLDIYAWNLSDRPGRPIGGEAQGLRAMWAWLKARYGD